MSTPAVPDWAANIPSTPGVHTEPASNDQWENLSDDQIKQLRSKLITSIVQVVVQGITGVFNPGGGLSGALDQLTSWAEGIPLLGPIVEAITGALGGLGDLSDFFTTFFSAFDGIDMTDPGAILNAILDSLEDIPVVGELASLIENLVNGGQPINVLNLFGQLLPELFGPLPASWITQDNPEALTNAGFDGSISMDGEGIWTWDASDGHTSNGCASTTGNSTLKALLGNQITVAPNQKFTVAAYAKSIAYTGSGTPIKVTIKTYFYDAATGLTSPVGTATIAQGAGPGTTWTLMSGTYTVPSNGTVNRIRERLVVDTTCTGGTIKFDDATVKIQGNGPFDGLLQLFGLSSLEDLFDGLDINDIWGWIIQNIFNPLGLLDMNGVPVIGDIVDAITGGSGDGPSDVLGWIGDLLGILGGPTSMGSGTPVVNTTGRPPILKGLLDALFGGFTQNFSAPADQPAVADAASGVAQSITGAQAGLAQLQAALSPGTPDSDDFERSASGNWTTTQWMVMEDGNGGDASLDGHNAIWAADYTKDSEMVARRLVKAASTDNQTVAVVLNSGIGYVTDGNAALDLWLRMSAFTTYATRTGVRFRFWGNKDWELASFNAGTKSVITSGTHSKSVGSGTFSFEAGQSLAARRFVAKINAEPIMDFTEAGTTSLIGAAYRNRGAGLRGEYSVLGYIALPLQEIQPCSLKQWTATG